MIGQVIIGMTGALGLAMMPASNPKIRRLAPIVGLLGQPFWLHATWEAEAWGMFFVSCCYTATWLLALYAAFAAGAYRQRV